MSEAQKVSVYEFWKNRIEALEQINAKLSAENAALSERLKEAEGVIEKSSCWKIYSNYFPNERHDPLCAKCAYLSKTPKKEG